MFLDLQTQTPWTNRLHPSQRSIVPKPLLCLDESNALRRVTHRSSNRYWSTTHSVPKVTVHPHTTSWSCVHTLSRIQKCTCWTSRVLLHSSHGHVLVDDIDRYFVPRSTQVPEKIIRLCHYSRTFCLGRIVTPFCIRWVDAQFCYGFRTLVSIQFGLSFDWKECLIVSPHWSYFCQCLIVFCKQCIALLRKVMLVVYVQYFIAQSYSFLYFHTAPRTSHWFQRINHFSAGGSFQK